MGYFFGIRNASTISSANLTGLSMRLLIITGMLLLAAPVDAVEKSNAGQSPRLKFKNGPVCMCTDGLSEKDIRAAREREQTADEAGSNQNPQQLETSRHRDTEDE
jgi:hypothetical protein